MTFAATIVFTFDPAVVLIVLVYMILVTLRDGKDKPSFTASATVSPSPALQPQPGRAIVSRMSTNTVDYTVIEELDERHIGEKTKSATAQGPLTGIRWEHPGNPVEWGSYPKPAITNNDNDNDNDNAAYADSTRI